MILETEKIDELFETFMTNMDKGEYWEWISTWFDPSLPQQIAREWSPECKFHVLKKEGIIK